MNNKRQWCFGGALGVIVFFLYIHLIHYTVPVLGVILLVGYIATLALWWRDILHQVFRFEHGFVSLFFSTFATVFFVSSIEAIVIVLYTSTAVLTFVSLCISAGLTWLLRLFFLSQPHGSKIITKGRKQYIEVFPKKQIVSWIYRVLWGVTGILFVIAKGTGALFTPWQSLHPAIVPLMLVLTALLGYVIFSKQKTRHILTLMLMHSLLLHLYLPLSHELPWGGDVWRHIAVESQLSDGEIVQPVLFGPEAKWREVVGIDVPEAFLIPQKYTYGQFWSLAVLTNQVTGISLEAINIWMIPLLWSFVFPLVLFRIGRVIFRSWRGGLLFAWLSFVAFPLQALGALSLPVSLGVLSYFFFLMLWLQYLRKRHHVQRWFLGGLLCLMLFGYALSFLLALLTVVGTWLLETISNHARSATIGWTLVAVVGVVGVIAIPTVELTSGVSRLPQSIDVMRDSTQITGQFVGWYYASGIRPHDIASSNLFFNHTPAYAFVSTVFTAWRWWIIPVMILLWISVLYGLYRYVRERQPLRFLLPAWLLVSLVGSYKIGWFVLEGDRLFTRRLDPFLSTMLIMFVSLAVLTSFYHIRYKKHVVRRVTAMCLILAVSWFGAATYASGPDMRTSSVDEYAVAEFVLAEIGDDRDAYCVLADTWVLLPLEGLSSGDIVGGNFPIGYQFGQAERVGLFNDFLQVDVSASTVQQMFEVTGASSCFVVLSTETIAEDQEQTISDLLQTVPVRYSGFLLWKLEDPRLKSAEE